MDSIVAWEVTLLEPTSFWADVPPQISHLYQFYNIPITMNGTSKDCPLRFIQEKASIDDFVSFKLDIDSPYAEIPIALEMSTNPHIASLIDEFFFELHFKCEILHGCWGDVPEEIGGLKLDRISALRLFQKYRQSGIRSHFWP